MDHTLIRYNSENFESLAHKVMLDKLVNELGYPKEIKKLKFDFHRAIRGLVIDKNKGNVLKLSRFGAIRKSYHGLDPIDYGSQRRIYKSTYVDLSDPSFDTVDTTFSISFAALFSQLVQLKNGEANLKIPDFRIIANDLNVVLDRAHRDGSIKDVVRDNLTDYVIKDDQLVSGIKRYVQHGKKVFILTNSDYNYTKLLLDHCINPFLEKGETWETLFEFVITSAQKPRFFTDRLRFLKIDPTNGSMTNHEKKLSQGIYQGGSASVLTADLDLQPDEILYIGDHIYGDIVRLKKDCAWRTALVVEELDTETANLKKSLPVTTKINDLMEEKVPLEQKIDELASQQIEDNHQKFQKEIESLLKQISALDRKLSPLIQEQQAIFNSYWGEVMRVGLEESYFAYQVERFACIYMSRLTDLLEFSPRTYFRAPKRLMPHEMIS